ncbi:hypothetical protein SSS_06116 [Sarcoptes scabiei]|uniref:Uncharacterized protein n=1 Tax=Sarcoptes scabiei TaxID=52283 RepID=A0A834R947_SARSC|nr:hypothetical protein SSS_06116 [Sarcoptes scabiei]
MKLVKIKLKKNVQKYLDNAENRIRSQKNPKNLSYDTISLAGNWFRSDLDKSKCTSRSNSICSGRTDTLNSSVLSTISSSTYNSSCLDDHNDDDEDDNKDDIVQYLYDEDDLDGRNRFDSHSHLGLDDDPFEHQSHYLHFITTTIIIIIRIIIDITMFIDEIFRHHIHHHHLSSINLIYDQKSIIL